MLQDFLSRTRTIIIKYNHRQTFGNIVILAGIFSRKAAYLAYLAEYA